ncbi:MAG: Transcriptional repressor NrdR [Candidatus Moranbacteria bacterium GW2011_GWE2_35_2-]|nr:MAG: Transcriptional repressor NrdR [Candidatus Moranbacteria bacterium GW2011_GWE2_35_2-]KKQ06046.1 MAG: Transcriptional repressor NrdR [Candidatus Moranbacteria bacterium GW2011_GWF1_36_4]KKQ22983.1 MAG: Transcriptional repressor NrdR [Candidatus Moranbacteria bacterium GW2011_GWF2_37_11]KKQ29341.1 MAG: Transcriptional repressor NrdR [Candidatus Moranbacteria bacterium GW2011_GWD1_37_17]KKQ30786.1 MAG: Transcriptional repressor NrdR [Candidatus Moranbacteria bacterium GW2011_GWE1_37_24]KK
MICPFCNNNETKVVDSRDTNDRKAIRRRRECEKCNGRFSTYEEVEIMRLTVIKKDGQKREYSQDKVRSGIAKAIEKRPINDEKLEKILNDIEYEIHSREKDEITSKEIGRIILKKLKEVDEVAYLRFASVYKSFRSVDSFKKEMERLKT